MTLSGRGTRGDNNAWRWENKNSRASLTNASSDRMELPATDLAPYSAVGPDLRAFLANSL